MLVGFAVVVGFVLVGFALVGLAVADVVESESVGSGGSEVSVELALVVVAVGPVIVVILEG